MALPPSNLQEISFKSTAYRAEPPSAEGGHAYADVIKPEYWVHYAHKLVRGDKIEVFPQDSSYFAELLVLEVATGYAKVHTLLHSIIADATPVEDHNGYALEWVNPKTRFRVTRLSDGTIMKEGLPSKAAAQQYIDELNQNLAA